MDAVIGSGANRIINIHSVRKEKKSRWHTKLITRKWEHHIVYQGRLFCIVRFVATWFYWATKCVNKRGAWAYQPTQSRGQPMICALQSSEGVGKVEACPLLLLPLAGHFLRMARWISLDFCSGDAQNFHACAGISSHKLSPCVVCLSLEDWRSSLVYLVCVKTLYPAPH